MKKNFAETLKSLFRIHQRIDEHFFEELTDSLIEGDVGQALALHIEDELRKLVKDEKLKDPSELPFLLSQILEKHVQETFFVPMPDKRNIWLLLGVNGVGKTTSAAKIANYYREKHNTNVLLVAGDTFRAAAINQLKHHAEKLDMRIIANQQGGDAAAVVFDAGEALKSAGSGLALVDTAGRLHNREDLVRELQKIDRIARSKADDACYKKLIVLDATTGQNALRQAEVFKEAVGIDAVVLTKYDSSARGGIAISIGKELHVPVLFVCTGETYTDIAPFNSKEYVKTFLDL